MFRKILVAVDGSQHSLKAAGVAGELARQMKSDLVLVVSSFEEIPRYLGDGQIQEMIATRTV